MLIGGLMLHLHKTCEILLKKADKYAILNLRSFAEVVSLKIKKIIKSVMCAVLTASILCGCANADDIDSSAPTSDTSVPANNSSNTTSKDDRYRITRAKKPNGFKYKNVNIMCVGDSITQGSAVPSGYRYQLYEYLYLNGATFSLVGPLKTVSDSRLPSRYSGHAGYGGYKISDITAKASELAKTDCDIITLMVGVNDYLGNYETSTVSNRYTEMISAFLEKRPDAIIYCCSVCPTAGQIGKQKGYEINQYLPDICASFQKQGYKVFFADVFGSYEWNESCFDDTDSVHPNENGNRVIGRSLGDAMLDTILRINDEGDEKAAASKRVSGISVDKNEVNIDAYSAVTVKAKVTPADAEAFTVLWHSDNESVATVDSYGKIRGLKKGSAAITATTIDGGFTQKIKVTVNAASNKDYDEIFRDLLTVPDNWDGATDKFNNGFSTWFGGETYSLNTKQSFNAGKDFVLSMTYKVDGNTDADYSANYTSISYGGFTVKICNCVRRIELYQNDELLGKYEQNLKGTKAVYQLKYKNGTASVIYAGEEIISAKAGAPKVSTINIEVNEKYRSVYLTGIILKKAK